MQLLLKKTCNSCTGAGCAGRRWRASSARRKKSSARMVWGARILRVRSGSHRRKRGATVGTLAATAVMQAATINRIVAQIAARRALSRAGSRLRAITPRSMSNIKLVASGLCRLLPQANIYSAMGVTLNVLFTPGSSSESGKVSKSRGKTRIRLRATLDFSTFESRPPSLRAGLFFVVVTVVFW